MRDDENVALTKECNEIIQRKIPPKLTDPSRLTIPSLIGLIKFDQDLCDLGGKINLMLLSMMKRLGRGELKYTHMTPTLADCLVTYPYRILEDLLVKVDDLVFLETYIIFDMPEDSEPPLTLGRPFL